MTPRSRPLTSWDIERQQDRQDLDDDALPIFNPDASAGSIMHATDTRTSTNTNVKINNYIMWDVKKGGSSSEKAKAKEKPENSTNSGEAWEWFKTTNIPLKFAQEQACLKKKSTNGSRRVGPKDFSGSEHCQTNC